jgi:hypothetical protein
MKTHTTATLFLSLVAVALVAIGCGSDNSSSPTTVAAAATSTTASTSTSAAASGAAASTTTAGGSDAQMCAARDSLKSSVQALATAVTGIVSTGTSGVQTALDKVKSDLTTIKQLAKADVAPQVTATENTLNALQTAVSNFDSGGIGPVVTAATAFATSAGTLLATLSSLKCS